VAAHLVIFDCSIKTGQACGQAPQVVQVDCLLGIGRLSRPISGNDGFSPRRGGIGQQVGPSVDHLAGFSGLPVAVAGRRLAAALGAG
jgi:hypothetical protein